MKIYLADNYSHFKCILKFCNYKKRKLPKFLLQTFYDLKNVRQKEIEMMLNTCDSFLLDSGAFTFMNSGVKVNWKSYVDEYVEFINQYNIDKFFELDLYTLPDVGIERTIKIRKYIEHHTKKRSIPVFHKCMGLEMYRDLCNEYDYIAIGSSGITNESKWVQNKKLLKQMVRIANSYDTKVHGLGYTRLNNLNKTEIPFYSVDSSSWVGSRFNTRYDFKNGYIINKKACGENERLCDWKQLDLYNLSQWRKLQIYKNKE